MARISFVDDLKAPAKKAGEAKPTIKSAKVSDEKTEKGTK